jgi:MSHA pilin protein MshC
MVELIVVIILTGILGAVGASRFFDRAVFDTSSFASQAAAAMRFAQKEAIAQNRPVTVRFDGTSISLCFDTSSPCVAGKQVASPFAASTDSTYCSSARWYCIRRPDTVTYSLSLGSVSASAPAFVSFDALGRPSSGGTALGTVTTLTVNGGAGNSSVVSLEPETGYVH